MYIKLILGAYIFRLKYVKKLKFKANYCSVFSATVTAFFGTCLMSFSVDSAILLAWSCPGAQ